MCRAGNETLFDKAPDTPSVRRHRREDGSSGAHPSGPTLPAQQRLGKSKLRDKMRDAMAAAEYFRPGGRRAR